MERPGLSARTRQCAKIKHFRPGHVPGTKKASVHVARAPWAKRFYPGSKRSDGSLVTLPFQVRLKRHFLSPREKQLLLSVPTQAVNALGYSIHFRVTHFLT